MCYLIDCVNSQWVCVHVWFGKWHTIFFYFCWFLWKLYVVSLTHFVNECTIFYFWEHFIHKTYKQKRTHLLTYPWNKWRTKLYETKYFYRMNKVMVSNTKRNGTKRNEMNCIVLLHTHRNWFHLSVLIEWYIFWTNATYIFFSLLYFPFNYHIEWISRERNIHIYKY